MKRILSIVLAALFFLSVQSFAQISDNFNKGRAELGADLFFSLRNNNPMFSSSTTEAEKGEYFMTVDGGATIGAFVGQGCALSISPSVYYMKNRSNTSPEDYYQRIEIGLGLGGAYYLVLGQRAAMSIGAELGFDVVPGLDGMNSGAADPDDSLALNFSLEPKVALFLFTGPHVAPYIEGGYKLMYQRGIKSSSGADVVYASGYSMLDDLYTRINVAIGLKYFFPVGARFEGPGEKSYNSLMDELAK
jgi:hypothetical protein